MEQNIKLGLSPRHICIVCGKTYIWNPLHNGNGECECGSTMIFTKNNCEKLVPNKLLLITGGTGSGKNWIVQNLEKIFKNIPSITDRKIRDKEVPGVDYKFITTKEFKEIEELGFLIESVKFGNNLYGVESHELLDKLYNEDTGGILIVEPGGLLQVLFWLVEHHKCVGKLEIDQAFLNIPRAVRFNNIVGELVTGGFDLITAQEMALERIMRNNDSIPELYKEAEYKIKEAIQDLKSCGITVTQHTINNKEEMGQYVGQYAESFKTDENDKMIDVLVKKYLEFNLPIEDLIGKIYNNYNNYNKIQESK